MAFIFKSINNTTVEKKMKSTDNIIRYNQVLIKLFLIKTKKKKDQKKLNINKGNNNIKNK